MCIIAILPLEVARYTKRNNNNNYMHNVWEVSRFFPFNSRMGEYTVHTKFTEANLSSQCVLYIAIREAIRQMLLIL